MRNCKKI